LTRDKGVEGGGRVLDHGAGDGVAQLVRVAVVVVGHGLRSGDGAGVGGRLAGHAAVIVVDAAHGLLVAL